VSIFTKTKPAGTPTWFDLITPDPAKARDFYAKLFGWSYLIGGPEMGFYTMAQLDGKNVAGIGSPPPGSQMPSVWSVYLATDDIQADTAKIKQLGGQLMFEPMQVPENNGIMVMATDPSGAAFGLWQGGTHIGAEITEVPGTMTWCELHTRDVAKARDFYCALYGLTSAQMPGAPMEYYTIQRGGAKLAGVMQMDQKMPAFVPPHWVCYFQVGSVDEVAKQTVPHGGKVLSEPFDSPFGRLAWIEDPFGAQFVVLARPAA
jgi:uncharacterized protein